MRNSFDTSPAFAIHVIESWHVPVGQALMTERRVIVHPFDRIALELPRDPIARSEAVAEALVARVTAQLDAITEQLTARSLADLGALPARPGAVDRD